jgi:dienelactone hydrolase
MQLLRFVLAALALSLSTVALAGQEVTYSHAGTTMHGYLAKPAAAGKHPVVLVVHEWWGQTDYIRRRADLLAELGYVALAVDMYGDGKIADHPKDAGAFAGEVRNNMDVGEARFRAAMALLERQPEADLSRAAAIGYCFGGGVVLEMARAGVDLDGVVSFHGNLTTDHPARPGEVKAKVLVLNGGADRFTTAEQIERFKEEMASAGVDYRFINYPGARHSFTNPKADEYGRKFGMPIAYDPEADRKSWQAMQEFLAGIFR